ncbi:MAG: hypothetical protein ACU0CC_22955, partial [Sagittula sp.]|uniref:hypothetical protein n=1 Tax=Sagittula sp. TaxID=2038081 RepID=UPI004059D6D6
SNRLSNSDTASIPCHQRKFRENEDTHAELLDFDGAGNRALKKYRPITSTKVITDMQSSGAVTITLRTRSKDGDSR